LFCYDQTMLDLAKSLPEDPEDLRRFTALLLAEVKSQALLIAKLRHQLAGHRNHRFGASSETIEQLQLALEASEIAIAKMTAKQQPDEEKNKPKRRPIPDHIPRVEVELTGDDACAQCGGALRRLGEDVTEELEYLPGRFVVNRIVRPRMACTGCEAFTQASLPSRPIERGRPGPALPAPCLGEQIRRSPAASVIGRVWSTAKHPASRSILLSVVGTPPQDADCGGREAPRLRTHKQDSGSLRDVIHSPEIEGVFDVGPSLLAIRSPVRTLEAASAEQAARRASGR
jgi:hypothetical protein